MKNAISTIKSEQITIAVANLCKQANIFITDDLHKALLESYSGEQCIESKFILEQILENIELAAKHNRPICQDTGIVVVFVEIGQNVHIQGDLLEEAINAGVEKAYEENCFRKSIVKSPIFDRVNTGNNTPAVIYTNMVKGNSIKISLSIKGCGSENMSALKMLKPADGTDGIIQFVLDTVKNAGSNPCPPIRIGIGIGGTMDYAALLSKKALNLPISAYKELKTKADSDKISKLELEILDKVNKINIGAGGLGGNTTALGVNILTAPTHIAALPVAVNINCHVSRHASAKIDKNITQYNFNNFITEYNELHHNNPNIKRLNTNDINKIKELKVGDKFLLSGEIYTARDAAHKKLFEALQKGEELPVDIKDKIIYYVGPCPAKKDEIIGPAGPTTSGRMDKYTPTLLENGALGFIGKGERSQSVIDSIKDNKGFYLVTTGGAGVLLSKKVVKADIIAYPELGAEAIYKLEIVDFPVIVAIDSNGNNIFKLKN